MSSDPDYQHTSDTGDSSSKQTSSKKRTRGPTVLDRISKVRATGQKIPVETNYNGVPIEDSGKDLMTYLGIVTRDIVPINMASWGEVPKYLKDRIWDTLTNSFILPETEKFRKMMMKSAADKLKQFKTRLGRDYIWPFYEVDDHERMFNPPAKYKFITQDIWNEFVKSRLSDQFKETREKCIAQSRKTKFRHRTSRKGYAQLERDLQKKLQTTEKIQRYELWKQARVDKKGDFKKPEEAEIARRIDDLATKQSLGLIKPIGNNDILTEALGTPEHSGRLRAASWLSNPTLYWGKRNTVSMEEHKAVCNKVSQMETILMGILQWQEMLVQTNPNIPKLDLKALMGDKGVNLSSSSSINLNVTPTTSGKNVAEDPVIVGGTLENQKTSSSPTSPPATPLDDTTHSLGWCEGFSVPNMRCLLAAGQPDNYVAEGTVHAVGGKGMTLHNRPLPLEFVKVSVDRVIKPDAPVPCPNDDVELVKDALGTFVAWPRKFVTHDMDATQRPDTEVITDLDRLTQLSNEMAKDDVLSRNIQAPGLDVDFQSYVSPEDMHDFINLECISASSITWFFGNLVDLIDRIPGCPSYGFADPMRVSLLEGQEDPKSRGQYLSEVLLRVPTDSMVFVPYNGGSHWMLAVIKISKSTAYWMDPIGKPIRDDIKKVLGIAVRSYKKEKGLSQGKKDAVNIITLKAPRQPDSKTCGFYVLKYMKDIISQQMKTMSQKFSEAATYTEEEIKEIQLEWATSVLAASI